jgi:hypothetical protein
MPYPNKSSNKVFGQAMKKKQSSRYQKQFGGSRKGQDNSDNDHDKKAEEAAARRRLRQEQGEALDARFGFLRLEDQPLDNNSMEPIQRRGWLYHMLPTTVRYFGDWNQIVPNRYTMTHQDLLLLSLYYQTFTAH